MSTLEVFFYCWLSMICGFFMGCSWRGMFQSTNAEMRAADTDEHGEGL